MDAYKIDILHSGNKLKICAKVSFKLINLDVNYNYTLVKSEVNLVVLVNDLKSLIYLFLMYLKASKDELKPQESRKPLICILDSLNKFSKVSTNEFFDALPLCKEVDHKTEVVIGAIILSKAFYRLD